MHVYVFVRKDLSWPQRVVQACHACLEVGQKNFHGKMNHPHMVVIGIRDEAKLREVAEEIEQNVVIRRFHEGTEFTAFATQPVVEEQRQLFKRFMLLQE